jgi:hypothetical protein
MSLRMLGVQEIIARGEGGIGAPHRMNAQVSVASSS